MSQLVALVTGANKGIGKETSRQLARHGMTVLAGSRDLERGEAAARDLAADGAVVTPLQLDVTDPGNLQVVAERIDREYGRLDVLVNNAGTVDGGPATGLTAEQARHVFGVNVLGVIAVIHTMLPLLRAAEKPRIVNVSSTTASFALTSAGTDFGGDAGSRLAYTASKAALNMLTVQYARAFAGDAGLAHLRINSATPGYTATDLNQHQGARTVGQGARIIVDLATQEYGPTGGFFNDQGDVPW
ncbi:Rossmann-fold NAD(P)-binding domain-containing protein [Flindersiella endophytica]